VSILVVDDAADTQLMIKLRLEREGYRVLTAGSGREALDAVRREGLPHLVILAIMMPHMDGFEVAEELRRMGDIPIIFLSALSDTTTKVTGLTRYAEDYVTKPFAFAELLARVQRVLLRAGQSHANEAEVAIDHRLRVNFAQQYVVVDDKRVGLTPMENRLLNILFNHRGRVLSPAFLLARAWDPEEQGTVGSLWVHIRRLRKKIEVDDQHPRYLLTVRGQGYCLPGPTAPGIDAR
jgi:DNA-binding response OmpR family regulator